MTAGELMYRHSEAWVRLITLERDWGIPREVLLRQALGGRNIPLPVLNDLLKGWQKHGRLLTMLN